MYPHILEGIIKSSVKHSNNFFSHIILHKKKHRQFQSHKDKVTPLKVATDLRITVCGYNNRATKTPTLGNRLPILAPTSYFPFSPIEFFYLKQNT